MLSPPCPEAIAICHRRLPLPTSSNKGALFRVKRDTPRSSSGLSCASRMNLASVKLFALKLPLPREGAAGASVLLLSCSAAAVCRPFAVHDLFY